MAERRVGFYHPDIGYWEGLARDELGQLKDSDLLKMQRDGTQLAPLKTQEGTEYDGKKWVKAKIPDERYASELDAYHDQVAKARGYESRLTIATYVDSAVEEWKKESREFLDWRDQTTLKLIEILNQKENRPTTAAFIESLPAPPWQINK